METKMIALNLLLQNDGQIVGVPKNPRTIRSSMLDQMKRSITDDPEMLHLRELLVYPLGNRFVVIAGNMRLKAMRELGYKEAPCKVLDPETKPRKLRAYALKDNVPVGDWDASALGDFDYTDLEAAGLESDMKETMGTNMFTSDKLSPLRKCHILLSFPVDRLIDIQDALDRLRGMDFIEIEQSSN